MKVEMYWLIPIVAYYVSDDLFGINEVTLYKGEWSDKNYAVAGDVLDGVSLSKFNQCFMESNTKSLV